MGPLSPSGVPLGTDDTGNLKANDSTAPHSANVVDICVGEGILGVGETGSSATADIEAVHITGAQSEISLTVILY